MVQGDPRFISTVSQPDDLQGSDSHGPSALLSAPGLSSIHLEAILASCPDPIVGETADGLINYWNAAAEQFYGRSQ